MPETRWKRLFDEDNNFNSMCETENKPFFFTCLKTSKTFQSVTQMQKYFTHYNILKISQNTFFWRWFESNGWNKSTFSFLGVWNQVKNKNKNVFRRKHTSFIVEISQNEKNVFFPPGFRHPEKKMFNENCFKLFYFYCFTLKNTSWKMYFSHLVSNMSEK